MRKEDESEKRRVDDYSFEELVLLFDKLWKLVIDKQIEENSPEWQMLVKEMGGDVNLARDFLYSKLENIALCIDGNLEPFFEKAGITDRVLKKEIQSLIPADCPALVVIKRYRNIPIIWMPSALESSQRKFALIHEATHAMDVTFKNAGFGDGVDDKDAIKSMRLILLNKKLSRLFLGIEVATFLALPLATNSADTLKSVTGLAAAGAAGLVTSLAIIFRQTLNYMGSKREKKADRYAKHVLEQVM